MVEPGPVPRRGQVSVGEQVEIVGFELAQPAARQRESRRDIVGLPAVARRRDLNPRWPSVRAPLELGEQRLVIGRMHRRIAGRAGYVADRRRPLPVEQRQGDGCQRHRSPAGEPQGQHRPCGQGPQAGHVPPHRVVHGEGGDGGDRVHRHAPAQHPLLSRQQEQGGCGEQGHPDEGREHEWLLATGRKGERQGAERAERRERHQGTAAPIPGQHHGDAGQRQEQAGNRAAASGEHGQPSSEHRTLSLQGEQCPQADRDAEGEGEAAREQHRRRARPEPQGRDAGAVAMPVTGEGSEQPRRRHRGQGPNEPRPERRRERREENAVAGQVVAPVPVVVPEQEAL